METIEKSNRQRRCSKTTVLERCLGKRRTTIDSNSTSRHVSARMLLETYFQAFVCHLENWQLVGNPKSSKNYVNYRRPHDIVMQDLVQ
jgi:hypothetical protein